MIILFCRDARKSCALWRKGRQDCAVRCCARGCDTHDPNQMHGACHEKEGTERPLTLSLALVEDVLQLGVDVCLLEKIGTAVCVEEGQISLLAALKAVVVAYCPHRLAAKKFAF